MVKALQLKCRGSSMVVQWLRLCTLNTGGLVSMSGQETRSHMPQLRVYMPQLKIPCAGRPCPTKQINRYVKKNNK